MGLKNEFPKFQNPILVNALSLIKTPKTLRMRVFAGPNGSGKSTIINAVSQDRSNNQPLDFGIYINADDIGIALRKNEFSFEHYEVETTQDEFQKIALLSGLVKEPFSTEEFINSYSLRNNRIRLLNIEADERLAQILADFLRKKLLMARKKFSFETVFSHPGKLDIMREAKSAGYKVYLYFVATESPKINIDRVANRKALNGHDVPQDKIISRYYRSLNLMYEAAQLAYQAYFFDNSGAESKLIAHFKLQANKKEWDKIEFNKLPEWFKIYYAETKAIDAHQTVNTSKKRKGKKGKKGKKTKKKK